MVRCVRRRYGDVVELRVGCCERFQRNRRRKTINTENFIAAVAMAEKWNRENNNKV